MISEQNIASLIGCNVTDAEGSKIGTVGQVFVDPATGRPNWATVRTGFFGLSESFVPLDQADEVDGELRVPYTKDVVKDAPRIDTDHELQDSEEDDLYAYYQGYGGGTYGGDSTAGYDTDRRNAYASGDADRVPEGYDTSGPTTDDAMTRSEERLHVGTETGADRTRATA